MLTVRSEVSCSCILQVLHCFMQRITTPHYFSISRHDINLRFKRKQAHNASFLVWQKPTDVGRPLNANMASQAQHEPPLAELGAGPTPTSDLESIYTALQAYPFDTDNEYLSGLASILGHPSTPPTAEELTSNPDLILQVRCFYFARKHGLPAIDPSAYSQWLASSPRPGAQNTADATISQSSTASTILPQSSISAPSREQGPPYPTSFAEIVDLITRNVPVPGIEEIPDTVLEHGSSKVDHTPRRKKPWENDGEDVSAAIPATAALPAGFPDAQPQPIAAETEYTSGRSTGGNGRLRGGDK